MRTAKWRHPPPERGSRDSGRGRRSQRPLNWASFSSKNRASSKFSWDSRRFRKFSLDFENCAGFCPKTANFPEFPLSGGPTPSGIRVFRRKTAKWWYPCREGFRDFGRGKRSGWSLDWASFSSKNRVGLKFSSELRMGPNFSYLLSELRERGFISEFSVGACSFPSFFVGKPRNSGRGTDRRTERLTPVAQPLERGSHHDDSISYKETHYVQTYHCHPAPGGLREGARGTGARRRRW